MLTYKKEGGQETQSKLNLFFTQIKLSQKKMRESANCLLL